MKEIFINQDKETRCYIMAAIFFFKGYSEVDDYSVWRGEQNLDMLGLSKRDMDIFPIPNYNKLVTNLRNISDKDIQDYIISNTYDEVLLSKNREALQLFIVFCLDLKYNLKDVEESMQLMEELREIKPVFNPYPLSSTNSNIQKPNSNNPYNNNGCLRFFIIFAITFILGLLIF